MPIEYTENSVHNIPQPTLKTVTKLIEGYASTSIINLVLHCEGKKMLSPDSLKQLRKTVLNRKVMRGGAESSANCLLRILDRTPGLRYFVLTGSYDQAMKLVRVHKRYHVIQRSSDDNRRSVAENSSQTNCSQSPISTTNTPFSESSYVAETDSEEHTYVC